MRIMKELDIFAKHFDWYTKDTEGYYVPTEKAPPEAIAAMKKCNDIAKRDKERHVHTI